MSDYLSRRAVLGALGVSALAPAAQSAVFQAVSIPFAAGELWPWLRAQLVLEPGVVWLDTAAFGPTVRAAMVREYRLREQRSMRHDRHLADSLGSQSMRGMLDAAAQFLGASADDIAFTRGTLEGLSIVARGLDLQPGDEILTTTHEHPAAVYPWLLEAQRRGLKVVQLPQSGVPVSPEAIVGRFAGAITPRTRVLLFSHVQYTDGTVMPVNQLSLLARGNNALSIVDGAQGPGQLDFRVADLDCDAYATSFHKWLGAPPGTGALWLRPALRERLAPLLVESHYGWSPLDRFGGTGGESIAGGWPPTQRKFGQASRYDAPALESVPLAFELQRVITRARIAARIRELASYLRRRVAELPGTEVLTPVSAAMSAGIVALRPAARDTRQIAESMAREDAIVVGQVTHAGVFDALRISLHAHNDLAQIDRFVDALRRRL